MSRVKISNPFLDSNEPDFLSHFGITCTKEICQYFNDVKFVCMSGSHGRIQLYAETFHREARICLSENLSKTDRYVMYKTGPVLWVNHGMGIPSLSIMLNELIKLLYYAEATDVTFIRVGTSGGIGVEPGTVVVSSGVLNELLEPVLILHVMGEVIKLDAILDKNLCDELYEFGKSLCIPLEKGITMSTDDFYEGQARLNGAFCNYTKSDKNNFLKKLYSMRVRNMEMEGVCFASITHRAGIRGAIVCATFVDRLNEDLARKDQAPNIFHEYEMRPFKVVSTYLIEKLECNKN
uniref:Nucleoside phosphorylase domain-containing protein n=1 Tax=Acrobeloides nanus TaxID=290746 RepID=A0A914C475_9BILA